VLDMPAYRPPLEGRRGLLRLDFNERTEGAPLDALLALARLAAEGAEAVAAYPEYGPYVSKLAHALGVRPDEVLPTNATDEAIQVVVQTYADAGTRMLLAAPTFAMFQVYARIAGVEPVEVPYEGPRMDFPEEAYLARLAADASIRIAVLVDPNNPTATDLPVGFVERVCRARPDVAVLVDEAYGAFTGRSAIPLVRDLPNLIVSQTFSKAHGLAGLRIGHLVSQAANIAALAKVRSPYSVNVAAMAAAGALLDAEVRDRREVSRSLPMPPHGPAGEPRAYVERAAEGMRILLEGLEARGIPVVRSGANFVLTRVGAEHASLVRALRERGVLVRDRSSDRGLEGHVRFTAGPPDHVRLLLETIDRIFARRALLLDMDGTLVDVSRSYIACTARTAARLLAEEGLPSEVTPADVHAMKARGGGTNDDWVCAREIVLERARAAGRALDLPLERVTAPFQELYLGSLAATERWLAPADLLLRLGRRWRLGIVTGRPRAEVDMAFALEGAAEARPLFREVVAREDVFPRLKPDPAGLDRALGALGCDPASSLYVGDSTDDMRAARAAGLRPIGVLAPFDPDPARTRTALLEAGAERVLDGILALEGLLL